MNDIKNKEKALKKVVIEEKPIAPVQTKDLPLHEQLRIFI